MESNSDEREIQCFPTEQEVNSVFAWWDRKKEIANGLYLALFHEEDNSGCFKFGLVDRSPDEEGYGGLLCARVYDTFGVCDPNIAAAAINDCLNCMMTGVRDVDPQQARVIMESRCNHVLALFQEIRPRDALELMMVAKLVMLDYLSNKEFVGSAMASTPEERTERQSRGIKLSRVYMEFKDRLDKHRRPEQPVTVQRNQIYNDGQAIIGSQLYVQK